MDRGVVHDLSPEVLLVFTVKDDALLSYTNCLPVAAAGVFVNLAGLVRSHSFSHRDDEDVLPLHNFIDDPVVFFVVVSIILFFAVFCVLFHEMLAFHDRSNKLASADDGVSVSSLVVATHEALVAHSDHVVEEVRLLLSHERTAEILAKSNKQ